MAWVKSLLCEQPMREEGNNFLFERSGSEGWQQLQDGAQERYGLHDYNSPTDLEVSALFGGFIAVDLPTDAVVLDIGCGPFGELQPYARDLNLKRYLGLEPIMATPEREYPCLVGCLAEDIPLKNESVDAAVFATSLDHIEEEDAAIVELKRILKPGGRILIWQGLHEPRFIAREKTFERVFFGSPSLLKRAARVAAGPIEYAVTGWRMLGRARKLRSGARLDSAHARWYTLEMMERSIKRWGAVKKRAILIPGSASAFFDLRFA